MMNFQQRITKAMTFEDFEKLAVEMKVRVAGGGSCGWTPLMEIVQRGNLNLAKAVLNKYGYFLVCLGNEFGKTPMHVAAELEEESLALSFIRLFRGLGDIADFNISTRSGETVLEAAYERGYNNVVRYLIDKCHAEDIYGSGDQREENSEKLGANAKRKRTSCNSSQEK